MKAVVAGFVAHGFGVWVMASVRWLLVIHLFINVKPANLL
jgi:hypothetical protein